MLFNSETEQTLIGREMVQSQPHCNCSKTCQISGSQAKDKRQRKEPAPRLPPTIVVLRSPPPTPGGTLSTTEPQFHLCGNINIKMHVERSRTSRPVVLPTEATTQGNGTRHPCCVVSDGTGGGSRTWREPVPVSPWIPSPGSAPGSRGPESISPVRRSALNSPRN